LAWLLDISTIDVGQGESSLIIARDTAPGGASRTMLIDGGESGYAATVHNFVAGRLALHGLAHVDVILTTHYDDDHSGGIIALLEADIFEAAAEIVGAAAARAALAAIAAGRVGQEVIAAAAAAAMAAALGAYDAPGGPMRANIADLAGADTHAVAIPLAKSNDQIARWAFRYGINRKAITLGAFNPIIVQGTTRCNSTAAAAAVLAGTLPVPTTLGPRSAGATAAAFTAMRTGIPANANFVTNGIYRNAALVDVGWTPNIPADYVNAVNAKAAFIGGGGAITVPTAAHGNRALGQAELTDEVLWDTLGGGGGALAPAGAPAAFVVAAGGWIWEVPAAQAPIPGGNDGNGLSIGLVVRFDNFYFYTGGDLPTTGEDALGVTVMAQTLPNPQGGMAFAAPASFSAFKCGHHGADSSTSTPFINALAAPVAIISVGGGVFNGVTHPGPAAVSRLHHNGNITNFYLTNCEDLRGYIPSSFGKNQIFPPLGAPTPPPVYPNYAPNKSRVAGDNGLANRIPGRPRGDIVIEVTQANATAGPGPARTFDITYFDDDDYGFGPLGATTVAQAF
jgi:beta-lactamase superfamily II metal-dependent hydrolase